MACTTNRRALSSKGWLHQRVPFEEDISDPTIVGDAEKPTL